MRDQEDMFVRVQRETDPVRQARLAGELISLHQQRLTELARLRKAAINRAAQQTGMNFTEIAAELGLTRGRISQIRKSAPPAERGFFGVGRLTVAVPLRLLPGRSLPVISSEDSLAAEALIEALTDYSFHVQRFHIPPDGEWDPSEETIAICGPKSSRVTAEAIASDPFLSFAPDTSGRWTVREREGSATYSPAMDQRETTSSDIAYVGRLTYRDSNLLVIAALHALGSLGAVDYLTRQLGEIYRVVGTKRFSMVVRSEHDGERVVRSELVCPPRVHA